MTFESFHDLEIFLDLGFFCVDVDKSIHPCSISPIIFTLVSARMSILKGQNKTGFEYKIALNRNKNQCAKKYKKVNKTLILTTMFANDLKTSQRHGR